jgi:hypothetical protein
MIVFVLQLGRIICCCRDMGSQDFQVWGFVGFLFPSPFLLMEAEEDVVV